MLNQPETPDLNGMTPEEFEWFLDGLSDYFSQIIAGARDGSIKFLAITSRDDGGQIKQRHIRLDRHGLNASTQLLN